MKNVGQEGWKVVALKMNTDAKACNYMYQLANNDIMIFGGWQNGTTSRHIDTLNLQDNELGRWGSPSLPCMLKEPDMITKPILRLNDSLIAV